MNALTTEQLEQLVSNAPKPESKLSHVDSLGFYHINDGHDLQDLEEIKNLRKENDSLKEQNRALRQHLENTRVSGPWD